MRGDRGQEGPHRSPDPLRHFLVLNRDKKSFGASQPRGAASGQKLTPSHGPAIPSRAEFFLPYDFCALRTASEVTDFAASFDCAEIKGSHLRTHCELARHIAPSAPANR